MRECGKLVRDRLVFKGLLEKVESCRGGQRYSLGRSLSFSLDKSYIRLPT